MKEILIVNGKPVTECMCSEPEKNGHYHPLCQQYCYLCNNNWHLCPDCGTISDHFSTPCGDCVETHE